MKHALNIVGGLSITFALLCGLAGCGHFLPLAGQTAQDTQAITQVSPPTGAVATQPAVITARPIVQAVGQAFGPSGETVLSLLAGISGLIFAGVSQYQKLTTKTKHLAAVAELAKAVPPTTILTPGTQRVIASTNT